MASVPTKKEIAAREIIQGKWPEFRDYRAATYRHLINGRSLSESDVRAVFERLLTGPLGYSPAQIDREPDFADFVLLSGDRKLAVVETKGWEAFRAERALDSALTQAANYADRHRIKPLFAFDGEVIVLALRKDDNIDVIFELKVDGQDSADDLFFFTEYGLDKITYSKLLNEPLRSFYVKSGPPPNECKKHHGVELHYTCFAYIGDLRDKKTWKLPYLNPDMSVDTGRIDKAVSFLLSAGGYRGATVNDRSIPEAAKLDVAKTLAKAYKQIDKWDDEKCNPVCRLREYLNTKGITVDQL